MSTQTESTYEHQLQKAARGIQIVNRTDEVNGMLPFLLEERLRNDMYEL